MTPIPSPLLIVTDRHQARRPLEAIIAEIVLAGARWVWLRDRDLEKGERRQLALRLVEIVHRAGGRLSIGDDIELAAEVATDAVHMRDIPAIKEARSRLGPQALIGLSAHSVGDVADAAAAGADYVTFSPIHDTQSKPGYGPPLGIEAITRAAGSRIPILALGGITPENILAARAAGAAGVAVMGGIMRATQPNRVVEGLMTRLQ